MACRRHGISRHGISRHDTLAKQTVLTHDGLDDSVLNL